MINLHLLNSQETFENIPTHKRRFSNDTEKEPNNFYSSFDAIEEKNNMQLDIENTETNSAKYNLVQDQIKTNRFFGVICILLSTICFSSMTFLCKVAYNDNPNLNGFDFLLLRSSSMALLSVLQVIQLRVNVIDVKPDQRFMLLIRCLAGGIGMPIFFIGLKFIPASIGSLIYNTNPIFISIFAFVFLKEEITKAKVFTVMGSFIGVALFLNNRHSSNQEFNGFYFGILCSFIYCISATCVTISTRLANKHMHYAISPFYFGITTFSEAMLLLIVMPSVYNFDHYTIYGVTLLLISGVANYMGQTLRSLALKYEDASVVSPFNYLQVVYLFISDVLVFKYSFQANEILGGLIISTCLLVPELYKCVKSNQNLTNQK